MNISTTKTISLALQGGGSHGAFTWGVLDRLMEEEHRLKIEAISATSSGAMNAAMLLQGYAKSGAAGAKEAMDLYWHRLGGLNAFGFSQRSFMDQMFGSWNMDSSPGAMMMDMMGRSFSPYQVNPMNFNQLNDLLRDVVDVDLIRNSAAFKLFVGATNVETGRVHIFTRDEISVDVLMASACIPFTFQAVKIDGVPYWDGGYTANPALFPLIYHCKTPDIAIVQLIPLTRKGTPEKMNDIINRLDEIDFNSALFSEMRSIALVQRLVDEKVLLPNTTHYKSINLHMVENEAEISALGATSKMNTEMEFLLHLKKMGRDAAEKWLRDTWKDIGERSSFPLEKLAAIDPMRK